MPNTVLVYLNRSEQDKLTMLIDFDKWNTMEEQNREEQCLRKAEEYVKEHDIQRIVKDCIVQLCIHRPDNPYSFLRQHFASLEKVCCDVTFYFRSD